MFSIKIKISLKMKQSYEVSYNVLENRMIYPEEKYAFENTGFEKDQEPETRADKNERKMRRKVKIQTSMKLQTLIMILNLMLSRVQNQENGAVRMTLWKMPRQKM